MPQRENIPLNSRIYIYGTGSAGLAQLAWFNKCRYDVTVIGFIDTYRNGRIAGKKIIRFAEFCRDVKSIDYELIVIASTYQKDIEAKLIENSISAYVVAEPLSYLLKEILPEPLKTRIKANLLFLASRVASFFGASKTHLFFGEHGGKFIGNNKYYFLRTFKNMKDQVFWIVDDDTLYDTLLTAKIPVLHFEKLKTKLILFSAGYFYFDNMTWQRRYPWLRHFAAKNIHMSHGIGLKYTEKMMIPDEFINRLTARELHRLNNKIFHNHLLISTSDFYAKKVSSPAYNTPMKNIVCSGYPKNDLFYEDIDGADIFADKVTLKIIQQLKSKIVVYAPTFRDMNAGFDYTSVLNTRNLHEYLKRNNILLVIKGHTSINLAADSVPTDNNHQNIILYQNDADGYPLLKLADLLITDYSSIYMDFLHCKKPILFFPYDIDSYLRDHRKLQFDYHEMTPGPKAYTQDELIRWIDIFLVKGIDDYKEIRGNISKLAFEHMDGKSWERINRAIKKL